MDGGSGSDDRIIRCVKREQGEESKCEKKKVSEGLKSKASKSN